MALKCWVHPLHLVSTICASVLRLLIYCSHLQSCITPPLCISQIILVVIIFLEINLLSKAPICQNSCCPPPPQRGTLGHFFAGRGAFYKVASNHPWQTGNVHVDRALFIKVLLKGILEMDKNTPGGGGHDFKMLDMKC